MLRTALTALMQQASGPVRVEAILPAAQVALSVTQLQQSRSMGGGSHAPAPETPLSKVLPPLVALPRQVVTTALSLTGKLLVGAAQSGPAKSVVSSFAEDVLMKESLVELSELDVSYWAYWLSTAGYSNAAGFRKLAEAAVPNVACMSPQQITDLVVGFNKAGVHDKGLLAAVSLNISANFTKFETEQLLKVLDALTAAGHYQQALYDDIADSITYANHYLAPLKAPVTEVVGALTAYAKNGHERADLFVTLCRGISEVALSQLSASARKDTVVAGLSALQRFKFYPEQVDALLYYTQTEPEHFSTDELALAASVKAEVESQTGGKLAVYQANPDEDAAHWYAHHAEHAPNHHELYVFRSALVPSAYSPAAFRKK